MKSSKLQILLSVSTCGLLLTGVPAWASSAKDGEQYVLRDASGVVYKMDDSSRAQSFEGKTVKVTGRLDADTKLIHVDTIEALVP